MDKIEQCFQRAAQATEAGEFETAIEAYEEILKLVPDSDRAFHLALWGIGEIYLNNQQIEPAISHLSRAVKLAPYQAHYQYLLGCAFTYSENIDMAILHLEKAVELDGSTWQFWNQLGWVVGFNRDPQQGITYLKQAIDIEPRATKTYRDMCMLYAKELNWDAAIGVLNQAIEIDPEEEELHMLVAQMEHFRNSMR